MTTTAKLESPTSRLVAGLVFTLLVIGSYAAYTVYSVRQMRRVQTDIVERNRLDSLQLIRIQNDLNALALSLRDMLDNREGYPLTAWRPALERVKRNLEDAVRREEELSRARRTPRETDYLTASFADFWRACDTMFEQASRGNEAEARRMVRDTLAPRQEALTASTARLLVENNEQELRAGAQIGAIYSQIERNAYWFLGASVVLIVITGIGLVRTNRRLFSRLAALAAERGELAHQLIATQESIFRGISRDLHDEFGQILTALGAMLRRARKSAPAPEFDEQLTETSTVVQGTLEKIRGLSQSLQPVILEEQGLLAAVEWHLSSFEKHTGIEVERRLTDQPVALAGDAAIHVFRILQEALNNVARHAGVERVKVSLESWGGLLRLVITDAGKGIGTPARGAGVGLTAMRERAELIGGRIAIENAPAGGTVVTFELPLEVAGG